MKKSVVTLLAVAALGAAVPTATVFANNNTALKAVDTKVTAKIAQLGKKASELQALRNLANERHVKASNDVIYFESALEVAKQNLATAEMNYNTALAAAQKAYDDTLAAKRTALAEAESGTVAVGDHVTSEEAGNAEVTAKIAKINADYDVVLNDLEVKVEAARANTGAVEAAKAAVATEEKNVAEAKKAQADAAAEVSKLQGEYEATVSEVAKLDASAAATMKAGEKPADSAKPAEMKKESAKPASKTVAAAMTKTAAKALPKTSAVK